MAPAGSVPPPCPPRPPSSSSGGVLQIACIELFKIKLIIITKIKFSSILQLGQARLGCSSLELASNWVFWTWILKYESLKE